MASVSAQDAPRKPSLLATRFSGSGGFYTPLSLGTAHSSILCVQGCLMPSPPWNRAGSTSAYGRKSPGTPSTLLGPWQTLDKFLLSKYQYLTELLGHLGYFFTFCKLNFWTRGKCYFVTLKKTHKSGYSKRMQGYNYKAWGGQGPGTGPAGSKARPATCAWLLNHVGVWGLVQKQAVAARATG